MYAIISSSDDTLMYVSDSIEIGESSIIIDNTVVPLDQIKEIKGQFYVEIDSIPEGYPDTVYLYENGNFIVKENIPEPTYEETVIQNYREKLAEEVAGNGYNS